MTSHLCCENIFTCEDILPGPHEVCVCVCVCVCVFACLRTHVLNLKKP